MVCVKDCYFFILVSSRSRGQHLRDDEDIFEDALLERLHDLRRDQDDDYDGYMYDDENDDTPHFAREELVHVLNAIKREVHHNHHQQSKKSVQNHLKIQDKEKRNSEQTPVKKAHKREKIDNKDSKPIEKKRELSSDIDIIKVHTSDSEKRGVDSEVNNQLAAVVPDDSLEEQNKIDKEVNLRDVLEKPVTAAPNTTQKPPSHGHVKQEITSTRTNKKGLDKVSFIGKGFYFTFFCLYSVQLVDKVLYEPPLIFDS